MTRDIEQVAAYAEAKGCTEAILIYPESTSIPLDANVGKIRVRSAGFSLSDDLESAGRRFVKDCMGLEIR